MEESARRRIPAVQPLVVDGVRYEQLRRARGRGFTQGGGVLAAFDARVDQAENDLWAVQLYVVAIDPDEERDAQEIYLVSLAHDAKHHAIVATDERDRVWSVDIATHAVTPAK